MRRAKTATQPPSNECFCHGYLFGGASLNGLIAGFIAGFVAVLPLLFIYVRFIKKETFTGDIHSIIGQAE